MNIDQLIIQGPPYLYIADISNEDLDNIRFQLQIRHTDYVFRILRGRKMHMIDGLFGEFAASLQFPLYFGENWKAFGDCLSDLDWLEGDGYILCINEASQLLMDETEEDFATFIRILIRVCGDWLEPNKYIPRERQPTNFRVVFQVPTKDTSSFLQRMQQAKVNPQYWHIMDVV